MKNCPMSYNTPNQKDILPCAQQMCAWWDEVHDQCVLLTIAGLDKNGTDIMHRDYPM